MIKPSLQKEIYPQLSNQRTKEFRHIIYNYILRRKKMLQKNLSKISTHTHIYIYIEGKFFLHIFDNSANNPSPESLAIHIQNPPTF